VATLLPFERFSPFFGDADDGWVYGCVWWSLVSKGGLRALFEATIGAGGGNPMVGLVRNDKCDKDIFLCDKDIFLALLACP